MSQATAQATSTTLNELRAAALPAVRPAEQATAIGFYNGPSYALLRDISKDFASSDIVPQRFQGKAANCMIAVNMAVRMQADPLMVMQNLYIVHGTPAWSAQFLISCFNQCGRFDPIQYEFFGKEGTDEWGCRAFAISRSSGARVEGSKITIAIAKKEGWFGKNGSKWQTMPEQMLRYRAASWMIRTCAPEIGMGFQTRDEVEDTWDMERMPDGHYEVTTQDLQAEKNAPAETPPAQTAPAGKKRGAAAATKNTATPASTGPASPATQTAGSTAEASPAGKQPPAKETPAQQPPHEPSDVEPGEDPFDGGQFVTCPNNGKQVDEYDCLQKPCRDGCPAFLE